MQNRVVSLRVKMDERVVGLMVGWGGCDCDGLVSNTLSLSMVSHFNPSFNCQPQSSVFQSHCVVATFVFFLFIIVSSVEDCKERFVKKEALVFTSSMEDIWMARYFYGSMATAHTIL